MVDCRSILRKDASNDEQSIPKVRRLFQLSNSKWASFPWGNVTPEKHPKQLTKADMRAIVTRLFGTIFDRPLIGQWRLRVALPNPF